MFLGLLALGLIDIALQGGQGHDSPFVYDLGNHI